MYSACMLKGCENHSEISMETNDGSDDSDVGEWTVEAMAGRQLNNLAYFDETRHWCCCHGNVDFYHIRKAILIHPQVVW